MQDILGVDLHMNPLSLLLGHPFQGATITASNHRLYDILAFSARKNIFMSWISDKPPTKTSWHKMIMECFTLEYLTYMLHSSTGQFMKIWAPYLRFSNNTVASTLSSVFPD